MLQRCYNPKHVSYEEYGGREIRVYLFWNPDALLGEGGRPELVRATAFANFVRDVGIKPSWRHTLDRKNANGDYVPDNVRWATPKEQGVNKRDTHFVRHPRTGERIAAATLADEMKISYQQLRAKMMKNNTWYALRYSEASAEVILKPGGEPVDGTKGTGGET